MSLEWKVGRTDVFPNSEELPSLQEVREKSRRHKFRGSALLVIDIDRDHRSCSILWKGRKGFRLDRDLNFSRLELSMLPLDLLDFCEKCPRIFGASLEEREGILVKRALSLR